MQNAGFPIYYIRILALKPCLQTEILPDVCILVEFLCINRIWRKTLSSENYGISYKQKNMLQTVPFIRVSRR